MESGFVKCVASKLGLEDSLNIELAAARELLQLPDRFIPNGTEDGRTVDNLLQSVADRYRVEILRFPSAQTSRLGRLYPRAGGFILKIRQEMAQPTFRFVLGHEFGHLFAYDCSAKEPRRTVANSSLEERFCDSLALHLLLPEELASRDLETVIAPGHYEGNPAALTALSSKWNVWPWHLVRRAISREQHGARLVALLWRRLTEAQLSYEITDYVAPAGIFVPKRDRSIKEGRVNRGPWEVLERGRPVSFHDEMRVGSISGRLSSLAIPSGNRSAVIQIIWLDENHLEKIERWKRSRSPHVVR